MKTILIIITWGICFLSCSDNLTQPGPGQPGGGQINPDWLVPVNEVFDGGPGKDGIPSIDQPRFSAVKEVDFLADDDIVIVVENEGDVRVFPHPILDWHEIVNSEIGGKPISITYCPLTGTTVIWDRVVNGKETTFGVSGLLFNSNLIPYDRETDTHWSQVLQLAINGPLITREPTQYPGQEMSWKTLKEAFPDAQILNTQTGFSRNYAVYPYSDYKTNNEYFLFPRARTDDRIPQKERTLAVFQFEKEPKIYRFSHFPSEGGLLEDEINGNKILVLCIPDKNVFTAFKIDENGYSYEDEDFPLVIKGPDGLKYDILGRAEGNLRLPYIRQMVGYWFTFPAFYENFDIHKG